MFIRGWQAFSIWLTLAAVPGLSLWATDWPQFLGPQRDGNSIETELLQDWPEGDLKVLWRVPGGVGMSAVVVFEGHALTLAHRERSQSLLVLDAKTGELVREVPLAPAFRNPMGDGPRATPAVAGDLAFAFTGEGILTAVQWKTGQIAWSVDAVTSRGGKPAEYGMAGSPLLSGDNVIVFPGGPGAAVAAYNQKSGELVWKAGTETLGYSSPVIRDIAGKPQLLAFTGSALLGLDPADGSQLWRYPYVTDYNCNTATPLVWQDQVFISAGENHGCVLLKVTGQGEQYQVEPVWESQGPGSVLRNEWQTSTLQGDYLYGFDNVGSAGPVTHLACVDIRTGATVWQEKRFGKGNLIAAEGRLWIATMKGELVCVAATPDGFQEQGRMKLFGTTRQTPTLADGLLYIRDDQEILCVDIRRKSYP